jgi:S-formylglutathione hydrolase FrmB
MGDMIVVMPRDNGDLFRGDHRVADYLSRDLVGHVDYEFPTLADRRHRAIDGLSTGGFTSLVLGAWRSEVFGSIGSMSGCHDARTFEAIESHAGRMKAAGQKYRISLGLEEPHADTCRAVSRALQAAGISADHAEAPGTHDWPLWRDGLGGHLRFHAGNMRD